MTDLYFTIGADHIQFYGEMIGDPLTVKFEQFHSCFDVITTKNIVGEPRVVLRTNTPHPRQHGNIYLQTDSKTIADFQKVLPDYQSIGTVEIKCPPGMTPQTLPENFRANVLNKISRHDRDIGEFTNMVQTLIHPNAVERIVENGGYRTILLKSKNESKNFFYSTSPKRLLDAAFGIPPTDTPGPDIN